MSFNADEHQHIRYNPLKDEWVLVSPHRALRPWSGQVESPTSSSTPIPPYDPTNPLCPGVVRSSGITTPHYTTTHVFTNDFPALLEDGPAPPDNPGEDLFKAKPAQGTCRVMCYHPKTNMYLDTMEKEYVVDNVIGEWIKQSIDLGSKYKWVQIFENRGAMMGCSNPHPHCQIWASNFLPNEARVKDSNFKKYYDRHTVPMLQHYVQREADKKERVVLENEEWLVVVPYWAVWPFEIMVLPKQQIQRFQDTTRTQQTLLADILQVLVRKYDGLFKCTFPYSMGWHGAPTGPNHTEGDSPHWTFHGIYYPPLLRSASVKKHMVGYELLANAQRDLTAEKAAKMLREVQVRNF